MRLFKLSVMYKTLFGPVPSRRLGMSLGVDLVPHKVCTLNCVYCECGPTTNLTTERKEYVPVQAVTKELDDYFIHNQKPDYITFSGAGEPTLNSGIGIIIKHIKTKYPDIPLALLTNGTLLSDLSVRQEILQTDLVLPSLDAATRMSFIKIDRPSPKLVIEDYIQGLVDFRKEYPGQIYLEVMIIPGYNDHEEELQLLKEAFLRIKPDKIQINTLDRPGTRTDIRAATPGELNLIKDFWNLDNAEIIASPPDRKKIKAYREDLESTILETISRRPCTLNDLSDILGMHVNEINKYLGVLEEEGKLKLDKGNRGIFYQITKNP